MWSSKSLAEKYKESNMDKKAVLEETYRSAFKDELEKIGISIDSIEGSLENYLSDAQEEVARDLIEKEKAKSFILRHPILTGIPTLGFAPLIQNAVSQDRIIKTMSRKDQAIRDMLNLIKQREHEINVATAGSSTNVNLNEVNI